MPQITANYMYLKKSEISKREKYFYSWYHSTKRKKLAYAVSNLGVVINCLFHACLIFLLMVRYAEHSTTRPVYGSVNHTQVYCYLCTGYYYNELALLTHSCTLKGYTLSIPFIYWTVTVNIENYHLPVYI